MDFLRSKTEILTDDPPYKQERSCHICSKPLGGSVLQTKKHYW
jgi:hypothetical protein